MDERVICGTVTVVLIAATVFGRPQSNESQEGTRRIELSEQYGQPVHDVVLGLYEDRDDEPLWLIDAKTRDAALNLLAATEESHEEGLCPVPGDISDLRDRLRTRLPDNPQAIRSLDVSLTEALTAHLLQRGLGHDSLTDHATSSRDLDVAHLLERAARAARGEEIDDLVGAVTPRHTEYLRLRQALRDYRALAERGTWPTLGDDVLLRPEEDMP